MNNEIEGKVIIITGASSGLGQATARLLASNGAKLVIAARRIERITALAEELRGNGATVLAIQTDVTQKDQVKALADAAQRELGRVDVLVNNAGVMPLSNLDALKVDEWDQMVDVNLKGVLYGIAAVLPYMKAQRSGQIINVASTAGHRVVPSSAVYSATKHAVRALSEGLRQEVADYNIRSTIISPGAIATELLDGISDKHLADQIRTAIAGSASMSADSVARVILFTISQPEDLGINEILLRPTSQKP